MGVILAGWLLRLGKMVNSQFDWLNDQVVNEWNYSTQQYIQNQGVNIFSFPRIYNKFWLFPAVVTKRSAINFRI